MQLTEVSLKEEIQTFVSLKIVIDYFLHAFVINGNILKFCVLVYRQEALIYSLKTMNNQEGVTFLPNRVVRFRRP